MRSRFYAHRAQAQARSGADLDEHVLVVEDNAISHRGSALLLAEHQRPREVRRGAPRTEGAEGLIARREVAVEARELLAPR